MFGKFVPTLNKCNSLNPFASCKYININKDMID